jgi:hypothetical protein
MKSLTLIIVFIFTLFTSLWSQSGAKLKPDTCVLSLTPIETTVKGVSSEESTHNESKSVHTATRKKQPDQVKSSIEVSSLSSTPEQPLPRTSSAKVTTKVAQPRLQKENVVPTIERIKHN